jgi:hypothetical protein
VEPAVSESLDTRSGTIAVRSSRTTTSVTASHGGAQQELAGRWVLPRVIEGGPPDGVTPDGRFAALVEPVAANRGVSRFAVLDLVKKTRRPQVIELPGEFTYDAWAPDGSRLYLIEHRAPAGSGKYVVRALDVSAGTLQPDAVADKRTQGEEMAGVPVARAATRDGRSVATLYLPHPSGSHGAGHEGLGRRTDRSSTCCSRTARRPSASTSPPRSTTVGHCRSPAAPCASRDPGSRPAYVVDLTSGALRRPECRVAPRTRWVGSARRWSGAGHRHHHRGVTEEPTRVSNEQAEQPEPDDVEELPGEPAPEDPEPTETEPQPPPARVESVVVPHWLQAGRPDHRAARLLTLARAARPVLLLFIVAESSR